MKQVLYGSKNTVSDSFFNLSGITRGVIIGFVLSFILFAVFAIILTFTSFPERMIPTVVTICSSVSILVAGSGSASSFKSRGWLHGGVIGLIYMIFLYLISGIAYSSFSINRFILMMTLFVILAGALGGIIGINLKNRRKYH